MCERSLQVIYFFEAFLAVFFRGVFWINSLESWDFNLPALFLWITPFFAALSAKETASATLLIVFVFLAARTAISNLLVMALFTSILTLEPLSALFAVFVTGMFNDLIFKTQNFFVVVSIRQRG